jgi:hypothetical protein
MRCHHTISRLVIRFVRRHTRLVRSDHANGLRMPVQWIRNDAFAPFSHRQYAQISVILVDMFRVFGYAAKQDFGAIYIALRWGLKRGYGGVP